MLWTSATSIKGQVKASETWSPTENPATHHKNGIGPIGTYSTKIGKSRLDCNARWIHDFDPSRRFEGDGFNFSASLKF